MKRRRILSFFLLSLLLVSCRNAEKGIDLSTLYERESYEETVQEAENQLHVRIDRDALYYKSMACYQLGRMDDATDAAILYRVLYPGERNEHLHNMLGLILFYAPEELAMKAAREIHDSFSFTKAELIRYYQLLMQESRTEDASELYDSLRSSLTSREATLLSITGKAPSSLIVSNLERWYGETGRLSEFVSSLEAAIDILLERGEGESLLSLALECYEIPEARLALSIGDIYQQMGERQQATRYWSYAESAFPGEVRRRLSAR